MISNIDKNKVILIVVANLLITFANVFFILPHQIFTGGLTGVSMLLNSWINIGIPNWLNIVTIIVIVLSYFFLSRKVAIQTTLSGVIFMLLFSYFSKYEVALVNSKLISTILAGLLFGIGMTICLKVESSSVSVDTVALILSEIFTLVSFKILLSIVSFILVFLGFLIFGSISVVYGIIYTLIYNKLYSILSKEGDVNVQKFSKTSSRA